MNSASAKFLRSICVDDAFFSLKEDVLGGFGGGTQFTVTSEKLDNLALMHVKINVLENGEDDIRRAALLAQAGHFVMF